ncbi:MAG: succinylglutamate desuccinylase/aspartoacylase family protein [Patescibacteria group bacterium]
MIIHSNCEHNKAFLTIVCCMHGDERFGLEVFAYYQKKLKAFPNLKLILANTQAVQARKRFIDHDLNRVFFKHPRNSYEGALARELRAAIRGTRYLLDIHTTTSSITMTPIVRSLAPSIRRIMNVTSSREIVYMGRIYARDSLIGQLDCGASLEFNERYARTNAARAELRSIVDGLYAGTRRSPFLRHVFYIDSSISKLQALPKGARNFVFMRRFKTYPFLLHERAYIDIHGFSASRAEWIRL